MDPNTMCDNKELLVSYLYDEANGHDRGAFERHLASCAECREELAELRSMRGSLASWAPPEPDFGFRIVRGAAAPPPRRFGYSPAWGLAAAAVLVLAVAAAIANLEVRYGQDGLVVRTGWANGVPAAQNANAGSAVPIATTVDWKADVDAIDRRLQQLETVAASSAGIQTLQVAGGSQMSDSEVVRRVREMIGQSETRQQRELTLRITALAREVDRQRRGDLVVMQQGLQGASGADAARHNQQMMGILRLVAQQSK